MEEVKNNPEVAAEAAVENAANAVVENPAEAANLLAVALDLTEGARSRQNEAFGRHFSSTQKVEVIKKGAKATLKDLAKWQANLEALLKEIEQQESANRLQAVVEDADNLTPDELQAMIEALQAKVAKAS